MVKNPPANAGDTEMWIRSLGWEAPLEEGMATHCSVLAWRIPWTEKPGGLQSMGLQRTEHNSSDLAHTQALSLAPFLSKIFSPQPRGRHIFVPFPFSCYLQREAKSIFFTVKLLLSSTVGKIHEIKK